MRAAVLGLAAGSLLAGCSNLTDSYATNEFSGDQFPIFVDSSSGAIMLAAALPDREGTPAVVDVMAPMTLFDPGDGVAPAIDADLVTLLGHTSPSNDAFVPRAELDTTYLELHPCNSVPCTVGDDDGVAFGAIIGAESLAGDALRIDLANQRLFLLPDVAGSRPVRGLACDAVFTSPYRGGGTLLVGGTEVGFDGRRISLGVCIGANPDEDLPLSQRGTDALMVVSTAIGTSILSESAYQRYRRDTNGTANQPPDLATLPTGTVTLASGPITGKLGTLPELALVEVSGSAPRGPCREVFAHHFLTEHDCAAGSADCPCDGDSVCGAPSVVELAPAPGLPVLIVADTNATLQSLRTELRPDQPEVDGILGTSALNNVVLDVDIPNNRVLARCSAAGCQARPPLPSTGARADVQACLK